MRFGKKHDQPDPEIAKRELEDIQKLNDLSASPIVEADFDYWGRMAYWSLDEAVALSFGKNPQFISDLKVHPSADLTDFWINFTMRRELASRALEVILSNDQIIPDSFLKWAKENSIECSDKLKSAVVRAKNAASRMAKPLEDRERQSLLRLVIGMAVEGYRYNPKDSRSQVLSDIVADLERCGVALDADTVRKWLRDAAELLPPNEK